MVRESHSSGLKALGAFKATHPCYQTHHLQCLAELLELAAQLGPCLPLSPIYIQGLSTTTETYTTANQLQTLLRVNHQRKHPTSHFVKCNTPRASSPSPSQQPLPHLPSLQRQTYPTNTTTLSQQQQAQQHYRSSTTAQQHGSTAQYPTRRISPVTQNTHTHAHSISDIDTRTTSHPVPPHQYHSTTHHTTQTHTLAFTPESAAAK